MQVNYTYRAVDVTSLVEVKVNTASITGRGIIEDINKSLTLPSISQSLTLTSMKTITAGQRLFPSFTHMPQSPVHPFQIASKKFLMSFLYLVLLSWLPFPTLGCHLS